MSHTILSEQNKVTLKESIQGYISTEKTFHIDAFDMEHITKEVYGFSIEMLESPNDTTHQYKIDGNMEKWDEVDLSTAITNGHLEFYKYHIILNDLCKNGYIEKGSYFLRMSW